MTYRAIIADGDIRCADYERGEQGVELYDEEEPSVAFVPSGSLVTLYAEDALPTDERSIARYQSAIRNVRAPFRSK